MAPTTLYNKQWERAKMGTPATAANGRNAVIYDEKCPMCTFQSRLLQRLDWLHRFEMVPASDTRVRLMAPQIEPTALQEAMHVITQNNAIHRGARAIRWMALRIPLLIPLGLLLWIPGAIFVAETVYRRVSRNRYVLSKVFGCKTACAVLPEKSPTLRGD